MCSGTPLVKFGIRFVPNEIWGHKKNEFCLYLHFIKNKTEISCTNLKEISILISVNTVMTLHWIWWTVAKICRGNEDIWLFLFCAFFLWSFWVIIFHIMLLAWDGQLSLKTKEAHGVDNEIDMKLTTSS